MNKEQIEELKQHPGYIRLVYDNNGRRSIVDRDGNILDTKEIRVERDSIVGRGKGGYRIYYELENGEKGSFTALYESEYSGPYNE